MTRGDALLAEGEGVLFETRRHPLFLALRLALWALGALVLVLAGIWVAVSGPIIGAAVLWALAVVPAGVGLVRLLKWRSERFVVTNHRVMQISGVLGRRVFDSSLQQVNDIMLTQTLFGRMLGYGNVEIITGSDIGLNNLQGIAHPLEFKRTIVEARSQLEEGRLAGGRMVQLLEALNELRDSGLISASEYETKRRQLVGQSS